MMFQPKKDLVYGFIIWIAPVIVIPFLISSFSLVLLIVFILTILLSLWIWNSCEYRIVNNELYLKCWILNNKIKINDILSIKKVRNVYSSFALSVKRLELELKSHSKLYVAPINFDDFIAELKTINHNIIIKD